MATDEEILRVWGSLPNKMKRDEAVIRLYRAAEEAGEMAARSAGIAAIGKELLSDATLEAAMNSFGWGRRDKRSTITMRAVMREALRIAKEKI